MGAELVKKDLELFLKTHVPDACLDNLDDIVLNYVAEVLGDLGRGEGESSFDMDQFSEMISAYVPEFSCIERSVVYQWVFELADRQQQNAANPRHETFHTPKSGASSKTDKKDKSLKTNPSTETHSNSEVSPKDATSAAKYSEQVSLLQEMFPGVVEETLLAVLMRCQGDMEVTIQKLLTTSGEDVGGRQLLEVKKAKDKVQADPSKTEVCGDKDIKKSVLARYAYVDMKEDKVTHRPVLAKPEAKKMVRYRDGHVVSTKGERFSVLTKKDTEGEDMKETYINLNPLRKYRFH